MPRPQTDESITAEFGRRVQARRRELGMSQERLAELASLHRTFTGAVERGETNASVTTVVKLAIALSVDPAVLVQGLDRFKRASDDSHRA